MRRARLKVKDGCYHIVSRINGKRFLIDDKEKSELLSAIRAAADFSGVEVFTYAMMTNHSHLLVRVPKKREVNDNELCRRVRSLYGDDRAEKVFKKWDNWEFFGLFAKVNDEKARLRARMYDLSQFCKTFKETYTQGYNKRTGNTGTIWEGRFKSNLVEPSARALLAVAAYIHLNPVRANMADTPDAAKWTGFGDAVAGDVAAKLGLIALITLIDQANQGPAKWSHVRGVFNHIHLGRMAVDGREQPASTKGAGSAAANQLKPLLMRRTSDFLNGAALGSPAFLRRVALMLPERRNRKPPGVFDDRPALGLSSALGVRGA